MGLSAEQVTAAGTVAAAFGTAVAALIAASAARSARTSAEGAAEGAEAAKRSAKLEEKQWADELEQRLVATWRCNHETDDTPGRAFHDLVLTNAGRHRAENVTIKAMDGGLTFTYDGAVSEMVHAIEPGDTERFGVFLEGNPPQGQRAVSLAITWTDGRGYPQTHAFNVHVKG